MFVWKIGNHFRENNGRMKRHLSSNWRAAFQGKSRRCGQVLHTPVLFLPQQTFILKYSTSETLSGSCVCLVFHSMLFCLIYVQRKLLISSDLCLRWDLGEYWGGGSVLEKGAAAGIYYFL